MIRLICPRCASDNIVRDATARWNGVDWVLNSTFDDMSCNDCYAEFDEAAEARPVDPADIVTGKKIH